MAILTLAWFLHSNGYALDMTNEEIEELAFATAESTDHAQALSDIQFRIRYGKRRSSRSSRPWRVN